MAAMATHRALDHHFLLDGNRSGLVLLRSLFRCFEADELVPAQEVYSLEIDGDVGRVLIGVGQPVERPAGDAASRIVTAVNREAMLSVSGVDVVHAAVASLGDVTVVIPAHSGSGKSTLSAALTAAGFTYFSDELAPIHPDLTVEAFPKPIVVGPGSMGVLKELASADIGDGRLGRWFLEPDRLSGGRALVGERRTVTHVVVPRYSPGAATAVRVPSPGEVAATLFVSSFNLATRKRTGLEHLASVATRAAAFEVTHSDAHELAKLLRDRLSA